MIWSVLNPFISVGRQVENSAVFPKFYAEGENPNSRLFENYGNYKYKIFSDSVKDQAMNSPLISTILYM